MEKVYRQYLDQPELYKQYKDQQPVIFSTPLWHFKNELPKGVDKWVRSYKQKNPKSSVFSNRGGYQSKQQPFDKFPYTMHIRNMLETFEPFNYFRIDGWWLNISGKGDYNVPHTHPGVDLTAIWYITDNGGLLYLQDPLIMSRSNLYSCIFKRPANIKVNAAAGDLLIFPADVPHSVEQHTSDTPRVSGSFNLMRN